MPNWIVGDLKVRGKKENIERFLLEGLSPVEFFGLSDEKVKIEKDEWSIAISIEKSIGFYIHETHRHFINTKHIEFYYPEEGGKGVLVLENFKAAWGIDASSLAKLSKKYLIDFKILGFERGMQFNQDVEIVNGEIVKNEEIKFKDYTWECIRPHIGG